MEHYLIISVDYTLARFVVNSHVKLHRHAWSAWSSTSIADG